MTHPLDGARAKIARATKHLKVFETNVETFLKSNPYPVVDEREPDGSKHTLRIHKPKRAPVEYWGLLIGDIVHNLRSALDHVAWQLVKKHGGSPTTATEFPIFIDPRRYHARKGQQRRAASGSGLLKVAGMDPAAQALIESMQPYHRPNPTLTDLWLVHRLDIIDKHQVIPVVTVAQAKGPLWVYELTRKVPFFFKVDTFEVSLEHNAVIAIVYIRPPSPAVKVHTKPAFLIALGQGMIETPPTKVTTVINILDGLRKTAVPAFTRRVEAFKGFF